MECRRELSRFLAGIIYCSLLAHYLVLCSDESNQADSSKYQPVPSVVTTKYGLLRGVVEILPNKHLQPVEKFLGVPYAGAPEGTLRFLPPGTPPQWKGIKNADHVGPVCPQRLPDISNETEALKRMPAGRYDYLKRLLPHLTNQSEDCLYLNIYAPAGSKCIIILFLLQLYLLCSIFIKHSMIYFGCNFIP